MKRIFTLITLVITAISIQAQQTISFEGLTASDVQFNESEWVWYNEAKTDLSLVTGVENVDHPITVKDIVFSTKRNSGGDRFFRLQESGLYANGTNVNIKVSGLKKDQEVVFKIQGAHTTTATTISVVSGCTADAENPTEAPAGGEFTAFKFIATGSEMVIKNGGARFVISTIEIGKAPESEDPIEEISETTTWKLTDVTEGTKLNIENIVNYNNSGLFLRSNNADGSHSVSAASIDASGTLSNGYNWSATLAFQCPGASLNESGVTGKDANAAAASGNDRCVAFKAATDGDIYVALTTTSYKTDRELYIWSSEGEKVASIASNDPSIVTVEDEEYTYHYGELKAEVKTGVSYFIGGSNQVRIACIQFIKKGDPIPTSIKNVVNTAAKNNGKWYNLQGQEVAQPTKGVFIQNGKKYIFK